MKIGFIGVGNMGSAILKGYLAANPGCETNIKAFDADSKKTEALAEEFGITAVSSVKDAVSGADLVLLAVKPNCMEAVLPEAAESREKNCLVVSIAAGISLAYLERFLGSDAKLIRVMPNTPALVGESMSALCGNRNVTDEDFACAKAVFDAVGRTEEVQESLIDSVIGVSGSSPAYVYMFIEALADGAVAEGMARDKAYVFAAQAVLGSAKMVLETGLHPGALKDAVCSPGGTTIESVCALEESGFRASVMQAVRAAAEKSREMGK
ncbi:MAG: pyrroline-5-carboxylate reductase [Firmicutes bacterium]|nr:pyrroline-5-carboxylate reductase [Bacillota bacterium]